MAKICHMTSAHGPEDERIFFKECCSLAAAGHEVYIVVKGNSYDKNGVHIVGIGDLPESRLKRMTSFARKVYEKALELDADIYQFHDPELLPYGLKLKKKGKKVIFDSHENTLDQIQEKSWIPNLVRKPMFHCFDWYQKHICKRLDAIISVSPHICEYFAAFHSKVVMITNYPVYKELKRDDCADDKSLCFAGGISDQWNHATVIQALEKLPEVRYVLLGSGDDAYLEELRTLPAWNRVDFRGRIPHEQVAQTLCACGIGVSVLSYNYNAGLRRGTLGNTKIYEQMMAGLPVICTDFQLWREMVDKYQCGICVEPQNVDDFVRAVQYLLDHPEEARRMGENGRRAVQEEYNWGKQEKLLLALYDDILGS